MRARDKIGPAERQRRYAELEAIKFGSRTSGSEVRQGKKPEVQKVLCGTATVRLKSS